MVPSFGFRVSGFVSWVSSFGFRVSIFDLRVSCFVFRVSVFVFRVPCFGFRVAAFGFRISGSRSRMLEDPIYMWGSKYLYQERVFQPRVWSTFAELRDQSTKVTMQMPTFKSTSVLKSPL